MNTIMRYKISPALPHTLRVKMLYKNALRNLKSTQNHLNWFRYEACQLRKRFDDNYCCDIETGKKLVREGEEELFKFRPLNIIRHAESYLGTAFEREVIPPDWVADYWHPLEKAQYPGYFACRNYRKQEYIMQWDEQCAGMKYCPDGPECMPPEPEEDSCIAPELPPSYDLPDKTDKKGKKPKKK